MKTEKGALFKMEKGALYEDGERSIVLRRRKEHCIKTKKKEHCVKTEEEAVSCIEMKTGTLYRTVIEKKCIPMFHKCVTDCFTHKLVAALKMLGWLILLSSSVMLKMLYTASL